MAYRKLTRTVENVQTQSHMILQSNIHRLAMEERQKADIAELEAVKARLTKLNERLTTVNPAQVDSLIAGMMATVDDVLTRVRLDQMTLPDNYGCNDPVDVPRWRGAMLGLILVMGLLMHPAIAQTSTTTVRDANTNTTTTATCTQVGADTHCNVKTMNSDLQDFSDNLARARTIGNWCKANGYKYEIGFGKKSREDRKTCFKAYADHQGTK